MQPSADQHGPAVTTALSLAVNDFAPIIRAEENFIGVRRFMLTIDGHTTVRELLTEHPGAYDVLVSRGMCEDCKENPPPVPLEHFAEKHCGGDLDNLIEQLRAAISQDNAPQG